jgi:hypothetical protein
VTPQPLLGFAFARSAAPKWARCQIRDGRQQILFGGKIVKNRGVIDTDDCSHVAKAQALEPLGGDLIESCLCKTLASIGFCNPAIWRPHCLPFCFDRRPFSVGFRRNPTAPGVAASAKLAGPHKQRRQCRSSVFKKSWRAVKREGTDLSRRPAGRWSVILSRVKRQ